MDDPVLDATALAHPSPEGVIATAVRAPSVHNTQPWRFSAEGPTIELYADRSRRLDVADPTGREMFISCGAALFGLRLAVRSTGFRPVVEVLPRWPRVDPLARVHLGAPAAVGPAERRFLSAVWRRHTHRGPFAPEPLPAGLLPALRRDAEAEAVALLVVGSRDNGPVHQLADDAMRSQAGDDAVAAELRRWTSREAAPDGVPARAYVARPTGGPHRLAQRDFDQGRGWGRLDAAGVPAATVILATAGDEPIDWLCAGQALHRVLLRAAGSWVFASLHSQPVEVPAVRRALRTRLRMAGAPQMVMQLGRAHTAPLTGRRPVGEVIEA
jgi:hypothetical protein